MPSLPQAPFVFTPKKVKQAPSSLLWKGDDQAPSLSVKWAEWEGSPHLEDKDTGPKRQSCFTGVKSPAALAFGLSEAPFKGGAWALGPPQSWQAALGEGSTRVGNSWGGAPPAFLASVGTQVDALPFPPFGVLRGVVGLFCCSFGWFFFFFFCTWPTPDSGALPRWFHFRAPMH